jgi:hypothetical protein
MNKSLSNSIVSLGDDLVLKKLFANPTDLIVEDKPEWICPNVGDKVQIVSYDTQCDVKECVRVSKLPYLTVSEVNPIVVGIGNDRYCWAYEIYVEETNLNFLQYHYKILNHPN